MANASKPVDKKAVDKAFEEFLRLNELEDRVNWVDFINELPTPIRGAVNERIEAFFRLRDTLSQRPESLKAGRCIGGFRLVRPVGVGATCVVWEAIQLSVGRPVAIKLLNPQFCLQEGFLARFQNEAIAASRVLHPNLVHVIEVGEDDGNFFLAEELVPNARTLSEWIFEHRNQAQLDGQHFRRIATFFRRIADALSVAHKAGIVHADVKPDNILIAEDGRPRLVDFGFSILEGASSILDELPPIATPLYMSPEQASASELPVDFRTDIFSLGVSMFEALTMQRPFGGRSREEIRRNLQGFSPPDPCRIEKSIPPQLAAICQYSMSGRREDRYQSAAAMRDDLNNFLQHKPVVAQPPSRAHRLSLWSRRHPFHTGAILTGVIGLLITTILSYQLYYENLDKEAALSAESVERKKATLAAEEAAEQAAVAEHTLFFLSSTFAGFLPNRSIDITAQELLSGAVSRMDELLDEPTLHRARMLKMLGEFFQSISFQKESEKFYVESIRIQEQLGIKDRKFLFYSYFNLGQVRMLFLDFVGAEVALESAQDLADPDDWNEHALVQASMGHLLLYQNRLIEAEPLLIQAHDAFASNDGADSSQALVVKGYLAELFQYSGRLELAETYMREIISTRERLGGNFLARYGYYIFALADILVDSSKTQEAEAALTRSLHWAQSKIGPTSEMALNVQVRLADYYQNQRQFAQAIALCEQVLLVAADMKALEDEVIHAKSTKALCLISLKKFADAEPLITELIPRVMDSFGPGHIESLHLLEMASICFMQVGEFQKGIEAAEFYFEGVKSLRGEGDIATANAGLRLVRVYRLADREMDAAILLKNMEKQTIPKLSAEQQREFCALVKEEKEIQLQINE